MTERNLDFFRDDDLCMGVLTNGNEEQGEAEQAPDEAGYEKPNGLDELTPKEIGRKGEQAAVRYLERRGYEILEQNWTCAAGEADIIALSEEGTLVFVEVKTRTSCELGFPEDKVDAEKRHRYERIAAYYLSTREFDDMMLRFDVIGILVVSSCRAMVKHHINAFGAE